MSSSGGVFMLGPHKVTSLDDISRYSDTLLFGSMSFQSLTDGRAEANEIQQGLKSEAEIAAYTLDEKLLGLERLKYFLFHKSSTPLQRQVGLASVMKEVCQIREGPSSSTSSPTPSTSLDEPLPPQRSIEGALSLVQSSLIPALARSSAVTPAAATTSPSYILTSQGDRILDSILPELQKQVISGWEWELQMKVASLYTDLISTHLLTRSRLETVIAPFLMRMLEGSTNSSNTNGDRPEEPTEEYLDVWLQPFLACIDALGLPATPPSPTSSVVMSPSKSSSAATAALSKPSTLLTGAILDFSLKKGTQYLLSQPIHVRILCVQIWGQLCKHFDWQLIQDRLLEPALSMCQDTSGSVRYHMCRQLVPLIQALSPTFIHHKHSIGSSISPSSPSSCSLCPPAPASPTDPSQPLALILVELEELLKDEEREVKIRAFQTLIQALDAFPDGLRKTKCIPLLRNYIQLPPKGMLLMIASNFGQIIFKLKQDLLPELADKAVATSASTPVDLTQIQQLVKTLIAFYKNLPFLSPSSTSELTGASSLHSPSSSNTLPFSPSSSGNNSSSTNLASEPRKYCAMNFVAVLSILGRVGLSSTSSSTPASSTTSTSSSSPAPEARFFQDHFSSLFHKLWKDEDDDIRGIMTTSFFEIVSSLGGLGSSLTSHRLNKTIAIQGLGTMSAFKLTKDAFLGMLHEGNSSASSSSSTSNSNGTNPSTMMRTPSLNISNSPSLSSSTPAIPLSASVANLIQYLIEGGKLEHILSIYYANHFGSTVLGSFTQSSTSTGSSLENIFDSWSGFLHETLRSLLAYESSLHTTQWRLKLTFWKAIAFLIKPQPPTPNAPTNGMTASNAKANGIIASSTTSSSAATPTSGPFRGYYFGTISALHSLGDLNNYSLLWDKYFPHLIHHMHASAQPLKHACGSILLTFMLSTPFALRRSEAHQRYLREFATSRSYGDRMVFVELARWLMGSITPEELNDGNWFGVTTITFSPNTKLLSNRLFKKLFFLPLLTLATDPVSNIRRKFIHTPILQQLRRMLLSTETHLVEIFNKTVQAVKSLAPQNERDSPFLTGLDPRSDLPTLSSPEAAIDRACEESEEALLRAEEVWLTEERHRAALAMSGGNVSLATAAIGQGGNYTPTGGPSEKGTNTSTATSNSTANGAKDSDMKKLPVRRGSLTVGASTKSLLETPDGASSNTTTKRRSANPDTIAAMNANLKGSTTTGTSSSNGAPPTANRSISIKNSKSTLKINPTNASGGNSNPNATPTSNSPGPGSPSLNSMLNAPKGIKRYTSNPLPTHSPPSTTTTPTTVSSTLLPGYKDANAKVASSGGGPVTSSNSSSSNTKPPLPPTSTNATNVASMMPSKNHQRNTVDMLLGKTTANSSSPAMNSNTPTGSPTPLSLASRPNRGGGGALEFPPSSSAASSNSSSTHLHVPSSSTNANNSHGHEETSKHPNLNYEEDTSAVAMRTLNRAASAGGGSMGAGGSSQNSLTNTPLTTSVAQRVRPTPTPVAVRSSKLLSANLSLSAARIVASTSSGGGGGSTTNMNSNSNNISSPSPSSSPIAPSPNNNNLSPQMLPLPVRSSVLSSGSALGRSASPMLTTNLNAAAGAASSATNSSTAGRPRLGNTIGSNPSGQRSPQTILPSSGSLSDRSSERESHGGMVGRSRVGGPVVSRTNLSVPNASLGLPKIDSPNSTSAASGNSPSQSTHGSASMIASGPSASASKLYSKEPLAHAHMRKFKLSQRSQLPTAELLRSEATNLYPPSAASSSSTHPSGMSAMGVGLSTTSVTIGHGRRRSLNGRPGHATHQSQ